MQIKDKWYFNAEVGHIGSCNVNFTANGNSYTHMDTNTIGTLCFDSTTVYADRSGWTDEAYRLIDFGENAQNISDSFYSEFVCAAKPCIEYDFSGTTGVVFEVGGKYCPKHIYAIPKDGQALKLQEKTVAPSEVVQNVTADNGYNAISECEVLAIQTEEKQITENGTVYPTTGKYIKKVVTNVPQYTNVSDTTATTGDVLTGKAFYNSAGEKQDGTIPIRSSSTVALVNKTDSVEFASGYYASPCSVDIADTEQAKIIPTNIKKDTVIMGVTGTFEGVQNYPTLNAPTISITDSTLTITDGNNGTFKDGYKIYSGATLIDTIQTDTYDLSSLSAGSHQITAKCYGDLFNDSIASNVANYNVALSAPTIGLQGDRVMWSAIDGADSYGVYYDTENSGYVLRAKVTTTYCDLNLLALDSGTNSIGVKALKAGCDSGLSNVVVYQCATTNFAQNAAYNYNGKTITFKCYSYDYPYGYTGTFKIAFKNGTELRGDTNSGISFGMFDPYSQTTTAIVSGALPNTCDIAYSFHDGTGDIGADCAVDKFYFGASEVTAETFYASIRIGFTKPAEPSFTQVYPTKYSDYTKLSNMDTAKKYMCKTYQSYYSEDIYFTLQYQNGAWDYAMPPTGVAFDGSLSIVEQTATEITFKFIEGGDGAYFESWASIVAVETASVPESSADYLAAFTGLSSADNLASWICFVEGTQITMADGTTKSVEDIEYGDNVLCYDFTNGEQTTAAIDWMIPKRTATEYWQIVLSDGTVLMLVGSNDKSHRLYNATKQMFMYPQDFEPTDLTIKENGAVANIVSCEKIYDTVNFYNIASAEHINVYANGTLTSNRLNNRFKIVDNKFTDKQIMTDEEISAYKEHLAAIKA